MKPKIILIVIAVVAVLISGILWLRGASVLLDKSPDLEKRILGTFFKYELNDANLTNNFIQEKKIGMRRYIHIYREYDAPRNFVWKNFESALKKGLDKTTFRITKSDQTFAKDKETYTLTISFGRFDILTLKVNKTKRAALPSMVKKFANPKIAIVMDDFGYNKNNLDELFNIKEPITLSILPDLKYSREIADLARSHGYEVILHLPLESHRKEVREELDTIKTGMSGKEVLARLTKEIESVPGLDGVSNHMGSKATEDKALMTTILTCLKKNSLYFFDSLTSEKSVCREVAGAVGVRYARRDMFLDNTNDTNYIEEQLLKLRKFAFRNGRVIAICHDRKTTIAVLSKIMPEMVRDGVKFVYLSELAK